MSITFKLAIRRLRRSPTTTVFAALALAVSVGAAGASTFLLNAIVLRPLEVRSPEQLVSIAPMIGEAILGIPGPTLTALRDSSGTMRQVCAYSRGAVAVQLGDRISRKGLEAFSGSCYELLGVRPFLGRLIGEADAPLVGVSAPVTVITHSFWKTAFNADPQIVGRILMVEGKPLTIIGVLPQSFAGMHVDQGPDLVVPLSLMSTLRGLPPRSLALYAITRVPSRTGLAQLRGDLRGAWPGLWRATNPGSDSRPVPAADPVNLQIESVQRGISDLRKQYTVSLFSLVGLSLLLVAMASANIAGLWVARAAHRVSEFRTLAAVGADASRIFAILTTETILIAAAAAAGAMAVSTVLTQLVAQMLWIGFLPLTMRLTPTVAQLLLVAASTAMLSFALLAPAAVYALRQSRSVLRTNVTGGIHAWRNGLLAAQAAVTLTLVFAAMLLTKNLIGLNTINPGYSTTGLSWGRIERLPGGERFDRRADMARLVGNVERIAGVQSAALSNTFPTTELRHLSALVPVTRPGSEASTGIREFRVSPGFFKTLGVPLIAGRDFEADDDATRNAVSIINITLARRLFPGEDPVGQFLTLVPSKRTVTVVGIVGDFSPGDVRIQDLPAVYSPYLQDTQPPGPSFLVFKSNTQIAFSTLADAIGSGNHQYLGVYKSVREHLLTLIGRERILFLVSTLLGTLGILLGAAGIFAALAHFVAERAKELAVRSAIGAPRYRLVRAVIAEVLLPLTTGVALGIPLALLAARRGAALLDLPSQTVAPILMLSVVIVGIAAAVAAFVPTRRALRLDPAVVLKEP